MKTPLHFLEDAKHRDWWHISNQHGPLCGAETSGTGWHLPDDDFVKVKLCLACWDIVSEVQQFINPAPDLLAALRPFAACAAAWDETDSDRVISWARRNVDGEPDLKLTVGDLLKAAAAIAKAEGGEG